MALRTAHHFNWFERGWNSSFGIFEQLIRRGVRVAQGDANPFSEQGFLDASLIPIIGAFDKQRGDVSDEEFIGRINQGLGTDLDPTNIGTAIGVSIFTDPLSFLTGGATAAAKAARASRAIDRYAVFGRAGQAIDPVKETAGSLIKKAETAAAAATRGERRGLNREIQALRQVDPKEKLSDLAFKETEKQLMVAVPFLSRYKAARFKTLSPEYKSWWSLANRGLGAGFEVAANIGAPLAKLPGLNLVVDQLAQVQHAYSLSSKALEGTRLGLDTSRRLGNRRGSELAEVLQEAEPLHARITNQGGPSGVLTHFDELNNPPEELIQKYERMGPYKRFLRAFGETSPKSQEAAQRKAETLWRKVNGGQNTPVPTTAEELQGALDNFYGETSALLAEYIPSSIRKVDTDAAKAFKEGMALDKVGRASFRLFEGVRRNFRKAFKTDFETGDITKLESERALRQDTARATTALRERAEALFPAIKEAADEAGMPTDKFSTLLSSTLESSALAEELQELTSLAAKDPGAHAKAVDNYLNRAQGALDVVEEMLRQYGKEDAATALNNIGLSRVLDDGVAAIFERSASRRKVAAKVGEKVAGDALRWPAPHGYQLPDGEYLGYLSNRELTQRATVASGEDLQAIEDVLELRKRGLIKQARRPDPTKVTPNPVPARDFAQGEGGGPLVGAVVDETLDPDALNDIGETIAFLAAHTAEARRLSKQGLDVPPEVLAGMNEGLQRFGVVVEQAVRRGLGERGNQVFDYLRQTQREILKESIRAGTLAPGSPIAYLPRILSNSQRQALRKIAGEIPTEIKTKLAPQMSSVFRRDLDQYSLVELNALDRALDDVAPDAEFTKGLREFMESEGLRAEKYTENPAEALLTRYGQAQQGRNTAEFIDNMIAQTAADDLPAFGGFEVTGFLDADGQKKIFGSTSKAKRTTATGKDQDLVKFQNEVLDEADSYRSIVLRDANTGREHVLDLASIGGGYGLMPVGRGGKTVGDAFASSAARGDGNLIENGRSISGAQLADLVGQKVLYGDSAVVGGMLQQVNEQYKHTQGFLAGYDAVHGVLKRFQTVYRPDFHIANFVSSLFQMGASPGVGPRAMSGAFVDTIRLLYGDQKEIAQNFDITARLLGKDGLIRGLKRSGTIAKQTGIEGSIIVGDQAYPLQDIFQEMADEGLLGTFVSEGLRGSSAVSQTLTRIREAAEAGKGKVGRAFENGAEQSEAFVRVMSVFAHLRAGYSIPTAVRNTQRAMVNYSDITRFENSVMKRAFSFYTFPRHYIPEAWRQFNEDPANLSVLAESFQGLQTSGALSTDDGRAVLNLPGDYALDVSRLNAGADAMMMLPGLIAAADVSPTAQLEGSPGLADASGFLQLGALANLGYEVFDRDLAGDKSWLEEARGTIPQMKYLEVLMNGGNPELEQGLAESILDQLLPTRKTAPDHSRIVLRGRFNALRKNIQGELRDAIQRGDREDQQMLREQLKGLATTLRKLEKQQ